MNKVQVYRFRVTCCKVVFMLLRTILLLVVAVALLPPSRSGFLFPPYH